MEHQRNDILKIMTSASFVHLQVHSEFSLLDGAIRIPHLINACSEAHPAVALTDKGNILVVILFGAKAKGVHQIIGCEIHFCEDMTAKSKTIDA